MIHFIGRIFFAFLIFCKVGRGMEEVQKTSLMNLPNEILLEIIEYSSSGTRETLKKVCQRLYILYYQFFKIDEVVIKLYTFEGQKEGSRFLSYLAFEECQNLKKMFSLFLHQKFIENGISKKEKIKKLKFRPNSIPNLFQQAILKSLETRDCSIVEPLFKRIILLLETLIEKKMDCSIAQDCLEVCYRYGLGVEKNEKKAEFLEAKTHTYFSNLNKKYLKKKWFPWNFQLWMEPTFMMWFDLLDDLVKFRCAQAFLNHGQQFKSYAHMKFLKNWVTLNATQKRMIDFLEQENRDFFVKLQGCKCYMNLLIEFEGPFRPEGIEFIRKWLRSEAKDRIVSLIAGRVQSIFNLLEHIVLYFEILTLLQEQNEVEWESDLIQVLEKELEIFFNQEQILLLERLKLGEEKFKVTQFLLDLKVKKMNQLIEIAQQWLESSEAANLIKNFEIPFLILSSYYIGLDHYYYTAYYVQHMQKRENLGKTVLILNENMFGNSVDFADKVGAFIFFMDKPPIFQIVQFMKDWLKLKETQKSLKKWFHENRQVNYQTSIMKWCIKMNCYSLILEIFEEWVQNRLSEDLEILNLMNVQEFLNQIQLAGFCASSEIHKLLQPVYQGWLDREDVRLNLKKILPSYYIRIKDEAMGFFYLSSL